MKSITASLILSLLVFSFIHKSEEYEAPVLRSKNGVRDKYIVVFKKETKREHVQSAMIALQSTRDGVGKVHKEYESIKGFAASLSHNSLEQLRHDENVKYIEQDAVFKILQSNCLEQSGADWGISRVGNGKFSDKYIYPGSAGQNVVVYVVDTGVETTHKEFEGRAKFGANFVFPYLTRGDDQGHGTSVASLVAGKSLGIAKKAEIVSVKVMNMLGSGLTSDIVSGVDWVTKQSRKGIVNLSLGGGKSQALDDAVNEAHESGHAVVVAAGNSGEDACGVSPASASTVFSVGASDKNDNFASFSNFGKCVHAIAPGVNVLAASRSFLFLPRPAKRISGTSFSSPITAGVFALHKAACPDCSPDDLKKRVLDSVVKDQIKGVNGDTPNSFVHSDCSLYN